MFLSDFSIVAFLIGGRWHLHFWCQEPENSSVLSPLISTQVLRLSLLCQRCSRQVAPTWVIPSLSWLLLCWGEACRFPALSSVGSWLFLALWETFWKVLFWACILKCLCAFLSQLQRSRRSAGNRLVCLGFFWSGVGESNLSPFLSVGMFTTASAMCGRGCLFSRAFFLHFWKIRQLDRLRLRCRAGFNSLSYVLSQCPGFIFCATVFVSQFCVSVA